MVIIPEKEENEEGMHPNPTRVYTIDGFIKILEQWKAKGYPAIAVRYGGLHGNLSSPSKTVNLYRVPLTLNGDLFASSSIVNIDPVGGNVPSCLVFIKKDNIKYLRADLADAIKENLEKRE